MKVQFQAESDRTGNKMDVNEAEVLTSITNENGFEMGKCEPAESLKPNQENERVSDDKNEKPVQSLAMHVTDENKLSATSNELDVAADVNNPCVVSDLNSNLNISISDKDPDLCETPHDTLEMAMKQSELTYLDDTSATDTSAQYESATEVYEKTGAEEDLLSESMIVNTSHEGTIVIVTSAEQHSSNDILVYETSASFLETNSGAAENVEINNLIAEEAPPDTVQADVGKEIVFTEANDTVDRCILGTVTQTIETNQTPAQTMQQPVEVEMVEEQGMETAEQVISTGQQSTEETTVSNTGEGTDSLSMEVDDDRPRVVEIVEEIKDEGQMVDVKNEEQQVAYETIKENEVTSIIIENDVLQDEPVNTNSDPQLVEVLEENLSYENVAHTLLSNDPNQSENESFLQSQNQDASYGSVEQQLSAIVKDDGESMEADVIEGVGNMQVKTNEGRQSLSIVEAISRDFDETDSEDVESESVAKSKENYAGDMTNIGQTVNIEHQQVFPQEVDGSPQHVYIVQSVEDVIVLENEQMDHPDTIELTVLSDTFQNVAQESTPVTKPAKANKERPSQIPSHVLGRNIDNPADDPFRNGKVPPKPRLGVKIPYRNLTSQIVSKDEIAQEILDRQKNKYGDLAQTPGDILFAKKLTQRLARKIAPLKPIQQEVRPAETATTEKINNSDLIAILEGDGDEVEGKKGAASDAGTSDVGTRASKILERQIALKQLNELPKGRGRFRKTFPDRTNANRLSGQVGQPRQVIASELKGDESNTESVKTQPKSEGTGNDKIKNEKAKTVECADKKSVPDVKISVEGKTIGDIKTNAKAVQEPKTSKQIKAGGDATPVEATTRDVDSNSKNAEKIAASADSKSETLLQVKGAVVETKTKGKNLAGNDAQPGPTQKRDPKVIEAPPAKAKSSDGHDQVKAASASIAKPPEPIIRAAEKSTKAAAKPEPLKSESTRSKEAEASTIKNFVVERKFSSNVPVKTYTRKRKSSDDMTMTSSIPEKRTAANAAGVQKEASSSYITKSSRVIKRKVIWDPDEPSTTKSSASMKSPKSTDAGAVKVEKPPSSKAISIGKVEKKILNKKSPAKTPDKYKKRLSEVDRLLMDEGAVNMLYALNADEAPKKKKATVISLDRAQRELLNKTNEIKRDLTNSSDKESPKSLRKKDGGPLVVTPSPKKAVVPAVISRKKSKDSARSSTHSRPTSPSLIYLHHAEASRIIRRHSSSSYSSEEGEEKIEEVDLQPPELTKSVVVAPPETEKLTKRKNAPAEGSKTKKVKRTEKENETVSVVLEKIKVGQESTKSFNKLIEVEDKSEHKYSKYKTFSVKTMDRLVQIILLPSVNNQVYLTPEILQELTGILNELQQDGDCSVVLVSSSAVSFCQGINYKTLVCDKEQTRKVIAKKLSTCISVFLKTLSSFTKIIIAGVHGDTVGLGVTMLPLFDMVIASDTATFSIPNARLGCAAEGGSLLSLPHLLHNVLVSELLYAARKLIAAEALRLGMVTRVLWPDKFQQELMSVVKVISNHSLQFMQKTKQQLRQHMLTDVEAALSREVDTLVEHWTSPECQKSFTVCG